MTPEDIIMADQKKRCRAAAKAVCTQFGGLGTHLPASLVEEIATTIHDTVFFTAFQPALSKQQRVLAKKHGTPAEFAVAVYKAVPGDISMDEARLAVAKYQREWDDAQ